MKPHYRTLWISDVHLGTKDCKAEQLIEFLKNTDFDTLYLVGDIVDGWRMRSKVYWRPAFTKLVRRLLSLSKQGIEVHYITGNHDECLRRFANNQLDNIRLSNRHTHITADGRRLLVIHGDQFDTITRCHHIWQLLGDKGYDLLMQINRILNNIRSRYGYGYWSLAGYLKERISKAQAYINDYEQGAAYAAKKMGFDGVICGHIHRAANKSINGVDYYNTGDWVESCTALAEDFNGQIHLLDCRQSTNNRCTDSDFFADSSEPVTASDLAARASLSVTEQEAAFIADKAFNHRAPPLIIPFKL